MISTGDVSHRPLVAQAPANFSKITSTGAVPRGTVLSET